MELLLVPGALIALAVLSIRYGYDSRELSMLDQRDRAHLAVRDGDLASYYRELDALDRAAAHGAERRIAGAYPRRRDDVSGMTRRLECGNAREEGTLLLPHPLSHSDLSCAER